MNISIFKLESFKGFQRSIFKLFLSNLSWATRKLERQDLKKVFPKK